MDNNKKGISFQCSKIMMFYGISLTFGIPIFFYKKALCDGDYFLFAKLFFVSIVSLYLMLLFCVKNLSFEKDHIDMFYCLRPFFRHYKYKYEDINIVICECGRSCETLYIKVKRHYPLVFVKNKCLFFQCRNIYETKNIVSILRENNINVVFRGDRGSIWFINENPDV